MMRSGMTLCVALLLGSCATTPAITGWASVSVTAGAETAPVGTAREDAADDPAIWRNPFDPAASLIVATDKKAGLHVYDLQGRERSFLAAPGLNNVDLVTLPDGRIVVAASDRSDLATAHIFVALLDPQTGRLAPVGRVSVGAGEGYGICAGDVNDDGSFVMYSAPKNGTIYRTALQFQGTQLVDQSEPLNQLASQPEGCVYDNRTGILYVGEEARGIWALDGRYQGGPDNLRLMAPVDNAMLVADVEGLALAPQGADGGYLVASSQGDNAYAVFRLPDMQPVGRFRIGAGQFGSVEETDGIALDNRSFGANFPAGLFIAQDGMNQPKAQNFKFVSWQDIEESLKTWTSPTP